MTGGNILRVLAVDKTANDAEPLIDNLRSAGYAVFQKHALGKSEFQSEVAAEEWDLVLYGATVEGLALGEVVRQLDAARSGTVVIVVYDEANRDGQACVVEALQAGASDAVSRANTLHFQLVVKREIERLALYRAHEKAARAHVEVQERSMVLLESSRDAIAYIHQGMHVYVNASYAKTFGFENLEELLGLPIMNIIVHSQQEDFKKVLRRYSSGELGQGYFEARCLTARGDEFQANMEFTTVTYEGEECLQVIVDPRSVKMGADLRECDVVPTLIDLQQLLSTVGSNFGHAKGKTGSLLYIEIDDFDGVRQRIGADHTEAFVFRVGTVIEDCVSGHLGLAKHTESAFALLIDMDAETGFQVADQVCQRVRECPFSDLTPAGETLLVSCSIGIASIRPGVGDGTLLLNRAIDACRTADTSGGTRIGVCKGRATGETNGASDSLSILYDALDKSRITLLFQPIVSLQGDSTAIYEVYPRVLDVEGNSVDVSESCSTVKAIDVLTKLDEWIVAEAVRVLVQQQEKKDAVNLFLKLSDHAFRNERLLLFLSERLRGARVAGQLITLQISEASALEQTKNVRAFLNGLKPLGCRSAIDHVGGERSKLDDLRKLPVNFLKLDASLCRDMMDAKEAKDGVAAVVALAASMGIQTIATEVEDARCLTVLWKNGVDLAQGCYIQEPSEVLQYDFAHES